MLTTMGPGQNSYTIDTNQVGKKTYLLFGIWDWQNSHIKEYVILLDRHNI